MSSILKALKKLESEKSQHDELSTAVASDILRSSHSSKKNNSMQVVIGAIVVVVLVGFGGYQFFRSTPPPAVEVKLPDQSVATESTSPVTEKPSVQKQPERSIVAEKQSTAETPVVQVQPEPDKTAILPQPDDLPQLSVIMFQESASDRMAVINDFPVMEGTMVETYLVKTIYPDRVVLERDGNNYELILPPQ